MDDFPRLITKRLHLGQILWTDIPKIMAYAGDARIAATTMNIPHPYNEKNAIGWIDKVYQGFEEKSQFTFAIRLKSDEFIGGIGLIINSRFNRAEMGYWIAVPFWNQGYATEAAGAILEFGFKSLQLNKIHACHLLQNPASGKVMIKNGMIKEGILKEHYRKGDQYLSIVQYRLTREEYIGF